MNGVPTGIVKFINQIQMASFGSFIGEARWTLVALGLGAADVYCLTRDSAGFQATGLALAGILVGALVVKTGVSAFSQKNVRETSREAYEGIAKVEEAKERGKAQGGAATREHAALSPVAAVQHADNVNIQGEAPTAAAPEQEWANGDPKAGVL